MHIEFCIPIIFRKFEGYINSDICFRPVPVDRQAGRQTDWQYGRLADENVILFEFFKIL